MIFIKVGTYNINIIINYNTMGNIIKCRGTEWSSELKRRLRRSWRWLRYLGHGVWKNFSSSKLLCPENKCRHPPPGHGRYIRVPNQKFCQTQHTRVPPPTDIKKYKTIQLMATVASRRTLDQLKKKKIFLRTKRLLEYFWKQKINLKGIIHFTFHACLNINCH